MPDLMIFNHEVAIMPHATIPLPDVYETVTRAVVVDVVRQIADYMTLPEKTTVFLPGKAEAVPMNGGMFGNCCSSDGVHFEPEEHVVIRYEEIAEENFVLSTAVRNNENYPVFIDNTHGIIARPVRRFVDFRIDIEYQAPNVVVAQRWLDDQRIRLSQGAGDLTFSLTYHYNVPKPALAVLKALYDTMQGSAWPVDKDFPGWLSEGWQSPTTDMATLTGGSPTLSIYERQVDVVGHFDFMTNPETPQKASDNSGAYVVNFTYICRYERPTHLVLNYPMVMHQCPIPKIFRREFIYENYQQSDRKTSVLRGSLDHAFRLMQIKGVPYIQYPDTDDWHTDIKPASTFTFFTGLLMLDCEDLTYLMDFRSLGRFTFNGIFLELFDTLGDKLLGDGSFFNVRLYRNDERLRIPLKMDRKTLKLHTEQPLDPQYYYHLQISINTNWYAVNDRYWQCLRRYPTAFWTLCNLFNVGVGRKPISEMQLLGVGRAREPSEDCPGEGTTDWVKDIDHFPTGIVKWGDIKEARDDQDVSIGGPGESGTWITHNRFGPVTVLFGRIITEKRPVKKEGVANATV